MSTARLNLFWIVIFGLTLPLGIVVSTHLARRSFERVKLRDQTITVKGYAERPITADRGMWNARITARAAEMVPAYASLERSRDLMLTFLKAHAFEVTDVDLSPVSITIVYERDKEGNRTNAIEGYVLSQDFSISGDDVALIARTARNASDLISKGVELNSSAPTYLYTKLDDMKLQMLSEAAQNARQRAEELVNHSGSRLGKLRSASQGVFQITPAYSTEVSGSGINDTESIDKVIKAVVTLEYAIE
ncbi:MAG: SIMPL domain-containing protein [Phycisphaeraceae bacterium]